MTRLSSILFPAAVLTAEAQWIVPPSLDLEGNAGAVAVGKGAAHCC